MIARNTEMESSQGSTYRIRSDLRVVCHADDWAFLITEVERRRVAGRLYVAILARLDEPRELDALCGELEAEFGAADVWHGLEQLMEAGYVVEGEGSPARGRGPAVPDPVVALDFLGAPDDGVIARSLADCGLTLAAGERPELRGELPERRGERPERRGERPERPELRILIVEDYLDPRLTAGIEEALAAGSPCLPFKPYGGIAWLGPLFTPEGGACWRCLLHRVQTNRPVEMYLHTCGKPLASVLPRPRSTELTRATASFFAGCELRRRARLRAPGTDRLEWNELVTLDLERMQRQERPLLGRPQCPACGNPRWMKEQLERPVELQSRKKLDTSDGGHRIEDAESTYRRLSRHIDSVIGPVCSLGEMPGKNHAQRPVFVAAHYLRPAPHQAAVDERFEQFSVGKGRAAAQARTSALCEALERQCARFQGDEPRVRGSYRELAPVALDPRDLLLFSEAQYAQGTPDLARARLLATPRSQVVPRPFDVNQPIDWAPAWSLSGESQALVPFAYLFAGAPQAEAERFCTWDSNGCAAGNCLEEAVLQGIFELVERDAAAIWWYNRIARPGMDLESFGQPYFIEVREHYARCGHELWLLDLTHDLEIPVVLALAAEQTGERYALGLGCHLDMSMAVQRAITELHQVFDPERRHAPLFTRSEIGDARFVRPSSELPVSTAASYQNPCADDLRDDLHLCMSRLRRAGLELFVANYSRPDVPLQTVKVMVPGLRHFWPRLAPGRLYDVPVKLGWLARPWGEDELNPLPLLM